MIVLFLAFSIPPDWVYLNAKTVQDRHTQRGIEMDNKVLDEAVEVALAAIRAEELQVLGGYKTPDNGARRETIRAALLAGVKVLLGEPVAWVVDDGGEEVIKFTPEFLEAWRGGLDISGCKFYAPSLGEGDGR